MSKSNISQFWISKDPDYDGRSGKIDSPGAREYWRTRTEPIFNAERNCFTLTKEAKKSGDEFVHLSMATKNILSEELFKLIKPGMKAKVSLYGVYEIKDQSDKVIETGIETKDQSNVFQVIPFNDRLIFGYKGVAKLQERKAVMYTRQQNTEYPFREEYVNEEGVVLKHDSNKGVYDCYTIFGKAGDAITPLVIGQLWGSDALTEEPLEQIRNDAENRGLKFTTPPEDNIIDLGVQLINEDIITIYGKSNYYGFGTDMKFSMKRMYRGEPTLQTRSIERAICDAVVCYKNYFNNPTLFVRVIFEHNKELETPVAWKSQEEFDNYIKCVTDFKETKVEQLSTLINESIELKYEKSIGLI